MPISKLFKRDFMTISSHARPEIFVLTRFSIRPDSELQEFIEDDKVPLFKDPSWLDQRLKGFSLVTVPSVAAQTEPDFGWLIGVDYETPSRVIERLESQLPANGRILYCDVDESFNVKVREILEKHNPAITVRLDSDDGLNRGFIAKVRSSKFGPGSALNFPHGLALSEKSGLTFRKLIPSNPFLVYFGREPGDHALELGTHSAVSSIIPIRNVLTPEPMWLKIYGVSATSKPPPNGIPIFWRTSTALSRLAPELGLHVPQPTLSAKMRSLIGFSGRTLSKKIVFLNLAYRFFRILGKKMGLSGYP